MQTGKFIRYMYLQHSGILSHLIMYGVECVLHTILEIRALLLRVIVDSNTSIFD